ncbi:hypothetical protein JCM3774_000096 [Rhodotorula dairenensis]
MPPKQPVFSFHAGSDADSAPASRSTSLDRAKTPNRNHSQSPQRRPILLHHASSHGTQRHFINPDPDGLESPCHHLVAVDEEAALEADGSGYEPGEHDTLLARGRGRQPDRADAPSRRRLTWSSGYGATHNGGPTATARHQHEPVEGGGATIKRQESILRVAGLIDDRSGEYEKFRKSDKELDKMSKKLRKFYEKQNETLDAFIEVDEILENARAKALTGELIPSVSAKQADSEEEARATIRWAINLNTVVNILLLGAKIAIVLVSRSMSLIASTVDSAMDFLSTLIVLGTSRYIEHRDWKSNYIYPTGKRRMEPLGVLVFSVFMISSFLQVLIESINRMLDPSVEPPHLPYVVLAVMIATIVIKSGVWLSCRAIKSASVEALQQDAENDIVFNFFSILFPYAGQLLASRYLDPLGGALLSLYIIVEWVSTLLDNVRKLTGRRAPPHEHQRIAYLLTRFSPLVTAIQHLSLYHAGEGLVCEVDIVLPPDTSLPIAHNLGEACQYAIEQLSGIERAFVHVDVAVNPLSGHLQSVSDKLATATTRRAPPAQLSLDFGAPAPAVEAAEYSPLQAPRLPFSSRGYGRASPTSSARTSSSSLSSQASFGSRTRSDPVAGSRTPQQQQQPRVELGLGQGYYSQGASPSVSVQSLPRVDEDMSGYSYENQGDGTEQEELVDESERPAHSKQNGLLDPYAFERPLDAVNRHSRLLDVAPAPQNVRDSRRMSRLPPGLTMVDPFGFNVAAETSPYDLALTASQAPATATLSSSAPPASRFSYSGVPGVSAAPVASSSSGYRASFMGAPPGLAENGSTAFAQPWNKQRASSHGELGTNGFGQPRSQIRHSSLSPNAAMRATSPKPGAGPSKLSGEVDLATRLSPSSKRQSVAPPIPTDADYLNSRLYQRTLKAQKALEKERAKAAAKGKTSRYETNNLASKSTSSLTSTLGGFGMRKRSGESLRPASIMSVAGVSGSSSIRRSGRKSFGWFRSASEAALPLSASTGSSAAAGGEKPQLSNMQTSLSLPKMPALPTRTSSNGASSSNHRAPSPQSAMPPSPNLPSEATLRSMGLSDDQIEAAAQAQGTVSSSTRPRLEGRPSNGDKRAPQRPPMSKESSAAQNPSDRSEPTLLAPELPRTGGQPLLQSSAHHLAPPVLAPPVPAVVTPPTGNSAEATPRSTSPATLAPPQGNILEPKPTRSPSPVAPDRPNGSVPTGPSSLNPPPSGSIYSPWPDQSALPRQLTRSPVVSELAPAQRAPPSARPAEEHARGPAWQQPPPAPAPPGLATQPQPQPQPLPQPQPQSQPQPQQPEYRRVASSSSSGGSRTPTRMDTLAVPGHAQAQSNRPAEVKRRKSGFGALFGFGGGGGGGGGGDKSASRSRSVSGGTAASLKQSGRSHTTITERDEVSPQDNRPRQTLKRVDERQREPPAAPAQKLSRERAHSNTNDGNGGLFGLGKSSRSDANGRGAHAPPKGAAPAAKAKKEAAPFYHPSQMLHAAEPEPQQPSGMRAINPSPAPSPRPDTGGRSFSGHSHGHGHGREPQERSSNGSSTAYNSSLSSSTSTFPPNKPGRQAPHDARSPRAQPQQQQQQQKKGAFSSLLSSYGSVRSRTRSSPGTAVPASAKLDGREGGRTEPPVSQQSQPQQQ